MSIAPPTYWHKTSLLFKAITCLLAAIAVVNILLMVMQLLPNHWYTTLPGFENAVIYGQVLLGPLLALGYSFWWHYQEKRQ